MSLSTTLTDSFELDIVVGLAEPCAAFATDVESASPVCAHCGWLDDEHPVAPARRSARVRVARRRRAFAAAS
jgi:hypothetical protein